MAHPKGPTIVPNPEQATSATNKLSLAYGWRNFQSTDAARKLMERNSTGNSLLGQNLATTAKFTLSKLPLDAKTAKQQAANLQAKQDVKNALTFNVAQKNFQQEVLKNKPPLPPVSQPIPDEALKNKGKPAPKNSPF